MYGLALHRFFEASAAVTDYLAADVNALREYEAEADADAGADAGAAGGVGRRALVRVGVHSRHRSEKTDVAAYDRQVGPSFLELVRSLS